MNVPLKQNYFQCDSHGEEDGGESGGDREDEPVETLSFWLEGKEEESSFVTLILSLLLEILYKRERIISELLL